MRHFTGEQRPTFKLQLRVHGVANVNGRHRIVENLLRQLLAVVIVQLGRSLGLGRRRHCANLMSASAPA